MWKALENNVFGKMKGEIFNAPLHAVQAHLEKGEIEEVKEIPKVETIKPIVNAEEVGKAYEEKLSPLVEAPKRRGRPARK
jgi:hypothetical protein